MTTEERLSTEDLVAPKQTDEQPAEEQPSRAEESSRAVEDRVQLFGQDEVEQFRGRWQSLQTAFVDDPRSTVQEADQLVAEVMQALAATFAEHKRELETQWQQGEEVATEDLRLALQRYRTFFNELLRD
ncbi:hypothetical protein FHX82_002287 [Amycolatopsis bartoniae]|uniref:Uncharacterized protein n=1 Tax=Amycolatopsis bartoniae TaxID=941986 RepID=A0A8H9M5B1_9PSEU|nr:hypothetical protein [Amycolatopsis bartoniae]MBB2935267.1 hypothetical protein [Amycolatopsis bartoniae]TVT06823.1 hypothetical protein FNH07_18865 [Amycolatopsis bartoniae]GHF55610.1 hypothetical protein GCM10017566_30800 [Amycolatopsis bartoniae]